MSLLVIAPHPDDETLGCGGTILKAAATGRVVDWVIVTSQKEPQWTAQEISTKNEEIRKVTEVYGFRNVIRLGFPSTGLDQVPASKLIAQVRDSVLSCRPQTIFIPGRLDAHGDHRRVSECAAAVLKPQNLRGLGVSEVLAYETPSSTEAAPVSSDRAAWFVDISAQFETKLAAMRLYESELQSDLMPRSELSMRAASRYIGSIIGVEYAERFALIWKLS
jgi:N-acetylglucosamine malate deacetylase 1